MPMTSAEALICASEETIRSLAKKLQEYVQTLSEEERALLKHLLLMALPPLKRRQLSPEAGLFSNGDLALLDSLTLEE